MKHCDIFKYCAFLASVLCAVQHDVNANTVFESNVYFDGFQYWSLTLRSMRSCAMACVKFPLCMSFNFDLNTSKCELNKDVLENYEEGRVSKAGSLYSSITDWHVQVSIDFSLTVKAATLIFISGRGSALSSTKKVNQVLFKI